MDRRHSKLERRLKTLSVAHMPAPTSDRPQHELYDCVIMTNRVKHPKRMLTVDELQGGSEKHDAFAVSRFTVGHRSALAPRRCLLQDKTYIYLALTRCPLFTKSRKDTKDSPQERPSAPTCAQRHDLGVESDLLDGVSLFRTLRAHETRL